MQDLKRMSAYEVNRENNMAENREIQKELGLDGPFFGSLPKGSGQRSRSGRGGGDGGSKDDQQEGHGDGGENNEYWEPWEGGDNDGRGEHGKGGGSGGDGGSSKGGGTGDGEDGGSNAGGGAGDGGGGGGGEDEVNASHVENDMDVDELANFHGTDNHGVNDSINNANTNTNAGGSIDNANTNGSIDNANANANGSNDNDNGGADGLENGIDVFEESFPLTVDESNWPAWLQKAYPALLAGDYGEKWVYLIRRWTELERRYGFRNPPHGFTTKNRPEAVKFWISRARPWEESKWPPLPSSEQLAKEWWSWWDAINPPWRQRAEDRLVVGGNGSWDEMKKPGQNGLLGVIACLLWWKAVLPEEDEEVDWYTAVRDVLWVVNQLLSASGEKHGREDEDDGSPVSKKQKR